MVNRSIFITFERFESFSDFKKGFYIPNLLAFDYFEPSNLQKLQQIVPK